MCNTIAEENQSAIDCNNSTTKLPLISDFMVIIISGEIKPMKIRQNANEQQELLGNRS